MQAQIGHEKLPARTPSDCFDDGIRRDRLSMESVTTSAACRCGSQQRLIPWCDGVMVKIGRRGSEIRGDHAVFWQQVTVGAGL
jgi:CDGSH-type Zn-finger protein